ncbi:ATP-binding protein [Bacillus sporothermodurans]|uniref:ATP-binding protein n=1 Tax=Heyndrickxia sporothermodurans TaxID=46224 RepID=A0AB37HDP7_9BACI|nr:ATP-binding protein [Heyndrickxia sporothermodurans]MED1711746.1 ATP-binding protein [Bacillus thuringiensis]MBL5768004.1 ATP-binding protein [Heyndrickxia sporothermodurans]MBL5771597.1 ATP-binding protein [Heyndrickxia sporothermodurans]MBL5785883.1 ATP-binding protein [Heyndrickxia sporothermodurans]MBL5789389.1 ATP-binding protein [Heyndrickxia sporothermodurans]
MERRFTSIAEVLADLQNKAENRSQVDKSGDSENASQYNCPTCKDKGFLLVKEPELNEDGLQKTWPNGTPKMIELLKDCTCSKKRQSDHLMKFSEITDEFKKMSFGSFSLEGKHELIHEAYGCAVDYYKDFDRIKGNRCNSISLLGQPGSGKTHLLTALANNLIQKKQISVLYFPFVEGFNDLKDDFNLLEEKITKMKRVGVLFIDDLFKGRDFPTPFQLEQMFGVINYRYLNYLPIMISSEKTVDDLCDIDEALGTRIYQMSKDYTVVIKGDRNVLNHRLEGLANV